MVDYLERDLYVWGRGAKVYRRYLKKIGYDRRKESAQLESMQIPSDVKEIIKSVELKVKEYKGLIKKEQDGLNRLDLEASMYLKEWRGWREIAKYEPKFAAKIPPEVNP